MKKHIKDFVLNGLLACGFGPVVLAIIYAILNAVGVVHTISVDKMAVEIISVSVLAFIAGGIGVVYKIERLPIVAATLIHALTLYVDYIVIYLINGWLGKGVIHILVFTVCFVVGFAVIWLTVYFTTKKNADRINARLADIQSATEY